MRRVYLDHAATTPVHPKVVKGKSIEEVLKISNKAVAEALDGLPPVKMHCSVLAEEALKSAIEEYLSKRKVEVNGRTSNLQNFSSTVLRAGDEGG